MTTTLSSAQLKTQLMNDLAGSTLTGLNHGAPKPARLLAAGEGPVYVYLWNLSESKPGTNRPRGELKLQVKVPGYRAGARQSLTHDDAPSIIAGFHWPTMSYCLWDARQRPYPAYSANLQARRHLCEEANRRGAVLEVPTSRRGSIIWRVYVVHCLFERALVGLRRHCMQSGSQAIPDTLAEVGVLD